MAGTDQDTRGVEASDSGMLSDPGGPPDPNASPPSPRTSAPAHTLEDRSVPALATAYTVTAEVHATPPYRTNPDQNSRASEVGGDAPGRVGGSSICSSCGSSTSSSSTLPSVSCSSNDCSPASSSGVSLSSPGTCSTPGELLPRGRSCSPPDTGIASDTGVESGASSCATIVQEEEVGEPSLEEGVVGDTSSTLSCSSCSSIGSGGQEEVHQEEEGEEEGGLEVLPGSNRIIECQKRQRLQDTIPLKHQQQQWQQQQQQKPQAITLTTQHPPSTAAINGVSGEVLLPPLPHPVNGSPPLQGSYPTCTTGGGGAKGLPYSCPTHEGPQQCPSSVHHNVRLQGETDGSGESPCPATRAQPITRAAPPLTSSTHNEQLIAALPASSPQQTPAKRGDTPLQQENIRVPPPQGITVCRKCGGHRGPGTTTCRFDVPVTTDFTDTSALLAGDELLRCCSPTDYSENERNIGRSSTGVCVSGGGESGGGGGGGGGGKSGLGGACLPVVSHSHVGSQTRHHTHTGEVVNSSCGSFSDTNPPSRGVGSLLSVTTFTGTYTTASNCISNSGSSCTNNCTSSRTHSLSSNKNSTCSSSHTQKDIDTRSLSVGIHHSSINQKDFKDKHQPNVDSVSTHHQQPPTSIRPVCNDTGDYVTSTNKDTAICVSNPAEGTERKNHKKSKTSLIKRYKAYRAAKIESQKEQHQLRQQQQQQQQQGRRASIDTIMEFDSNFHGNDDDDGLDSPMSDCTSLFSLGSEAEACLQEVMEGLGEDYCLTGAASSGDDESPGALEGRSLRWDKGRRKVKRPKSLTKSEYQELRQQCESGSNNNNRNSTGRARFVVQVDGQRLTPDEQAQSVLPSNADLGPRMAESSFMELDNVPSVSQPCTPNMPDLGIAATALHANNTLEQYNGNSSAPAGAGDGIIGSSLSTRQLTQLHVQPPQIQSPNGNSSRAELPTQDPPTSPDSSSTTALGTTGVQRPDVLLLNRTPNNTSYTIHPPRGAASPSQPHTPGHATSQDPQQPAPPGAVVLTPGGHRCCTCGQAVPPSYHPGDNANNDDSVNGNLATDNRAPSHTVVEVHADGTQQQAGLEGGDNGEVDDACSVNEDHVAPPVPPRNPSLASILTPMTPSQRFAYIDALQKKKQRNSIKGQSLAPPLHDNLRYHAFFLYHNNDRDWVLNVMEKLESPTLGFKCCCHERDLDCSLSLPQAVLYGIKNSVKTVVVLSPDFVSSTWSSCEVVVSEMDGVTLQRDLLLVMLQDCDLPNVITDLPYIDASKREWWTKMLATLALPDDTPMTEETVLSMSSSLVGLNPGLQSGHLLHSIKSKCLCCGRELVDPSEVPDELIAHGVQIPPEEYCQAIRQLMCESKFRCHIWCYNMPVAMVFFTLFLGLCLAIIPVIETKYMFIGTDLTHPSLPTPASKGVSVQPSKKQTGLEYVHGAVVWLCVLTLYMLCTHLARRKMKDKTYRRLSEVNTVFIKYNLLVGVENLGLADCNKYYLHFFYFELGPCLAYLQELVDNLEDVSPCYTNQAYLQELLVNLEECTPCYSNQAMDNDAQLEDPDDPEGCNQEASASDRMNVLDQNNITNVSMQTHAEDLLLDHSGEYLNMLITKKLDRPRKQRHVKGAYCLCQYVEQRVYKMVV